MSTATQDLLVEIGTEELPPKALANLAEDFHDRLTAIIWGQLNLLEPNHSKTYYFYSPRRLVVKIDNLRNQQPNRQIEKHGPAIKVAYDESGTPTKAAEGFARSCGTSIDRLEQRDGKLFYAVTESGKPASDLLPAAIIEALSKLPVPRRMRWGESAHEFVRPVHWVVVLLGDQVIDCEILGVKSDRYTRGHRYHYPEPVVLNSADDYVSTLQQAKVWLNDSEQQLNQIISEKVTILAEQVGGYALNSEPDSKLVAEVAALVEWPVPLRGEFDPKFLELPEEVLIATLEDQQRYFPIRDHDSGKLLPCFITVANIESRDPDQVRRGNERVIVPRLADAMFFWATDRATPLADRVPELDSMMFQKQLGSLGDKMRRVAELADHTAEAIGANPAYARRAAELAKCDLLSQLVGEFPELQGVAGGYLASNDGEESEVAQAISEQYRPRYAGDELPQSRTGQALAIADKLDTIVGIFSIGQAPTGERDPFALRRAALGMLRILIEKELDIDLQQLIRQAQQKLMTSAVGKNLQTADNNKLEADIFDFMMERLRAFYLDSGVSHDVFEAVLARRPTRPLDFQRRLLAVQSFRKLPEAESLAAANKRIRNILKQVDVVNGSLNKDILQAPAERELAMAIETLRERIEPLLADNEYEQALTSLAGLRDSVDAFFDNVMVLCEDENLKRNRIALLADLSDLFQRTADISRLQ